MASGADPEVNSSTKESFFACMERSRQKEMIRKDNTVLKMFGGNISYCALQKSCITNTHMKRSQLSESQKTQKTASSDNRITYYIYFFLLQRSFVCLYELSMLT